MVCYALPILDDGGVGIKRLHAIYTEAGALELTAQLYIFYQKNHPERRQLPASPVLHR